MSLFSDNVNEKINEEGWTEKIPVHKKRNRKDGDEFLEETRTPLAKTPYVTPREDLILELEEKIRQWTKELEGAEQKFFSEMQVYKRDLEQKIVEARERVEVYQSSMRR